MLTNLSENWTLNADERLVTPHTYEDACRAIASEERWVIDTETTGLRPYHGDMPFSVIVMAGGLLYYFNFNEYGDPSIPVLPGFEPLAEALSQPNRLAIFHNSKFDVRMLYNVGVDLHPSTRWYDTMVMERLVNQTYETFALDKVAPRYGFHKNDAVEEYIKKNKLWDWEEIPGKKTRQKRKYYDRVPFHIMLKYGFQDVRATAGVAFKQMEALRNLEQPLPPTLRSVYENEMRLLQTVYRMEARGVLIDRDFCERALAFETDRYWAMAKEFRGLTGKDYAPKPTLFKEVFKDEKWVYTEKGNASFDAKVIEGFTSDAAQIVKALRDAKYKMDTYQGFLYAADDTDVIHTQFNQHQARTGRFSSSAPNLQNMAKPTADDLAQEFTIRRVIVPRPGHFFAMIDYDQMEYRMMLDYAKARGLIEKVLGGLDVHQAMADVVDRPRSKVKNANFAILYGSGDETLAKTLGSSKEEATALRNAIMQASPEIEALAQKVRYKARRQNVVHDWLGRQFNFPGGKYTHKALNAIIQGGCADVVKVAMNRVDDYLADKESALVLTIHDELVIEVKYGEEHVVDEIKKIMESVYTPRCGLHLSASADWSERSLADKKPWGKT